MITFIQNYMYIAAAGALLVAGVFVLRFVLRFTWKILRVALIAVSLLVIMGYLFGFLDIVLH